MTFNIRFGTADDGLNSWPYRRDAALRFLAESDYSIIGLQEALISQLHEIASAAPHLRWLGVGRDDGIEEGEFCAILYDAQIARPVESGTFWLSDTPDVVASRSWGNTLTRICTWARFALAGTHVEVYNVHMDHASEISRLRSADLLAARVKLKAGAPAVVMGDFNEGETEPAVRRMVDAGFIDSYRQIHPDEPESATYHGWQPELLGANIDHIFVTPQVHVLAAEIIRENPYRTYLSDHYPVGATLELPVD